MTHVFSAARLQVRDLDLLAEGVDSRSAVLVHYLLRLVVDLEDAARSPALAAPPPGAPPPTGLTSSQAADGSGAESGAGNLGDPPPSLALQREVSSRGRAFEAAIDAIRSQALEESKASSGGGGEGTGGGEGGGPGFECLRLLAKIASNVQENPTELKFRRLRHSKPALHAHCLRFRGAGLALKAAGFVEQSLAVKEAKGGKVPHWVLEAVDMDALARLSFSLKKALEAWPRGL